MARRRRGEEPDSREDVKGFGSPADIDASRGETRGGTKGTPPQKVLRDAETMDAGLRPSSMFLPCLPHETHEETSGLRSARDREKRALTGVYQRRKEDGSANDAMVVSGWFKPLRRDTPPAAAASFCKRDSVFAGRVREGRPTSLQACAVESTGSGIRNGWRISNEAQSSRKQDVSQGQSRQMGKGLKQNWMLQQRHRFSAFLLFCFFCGVLFCSMGVSANAQSANSWNKRGQDAESRED